MSQAARPVAGSGMSLRAFRAFQGRQAEGERRELVEGTPVMMAPLRTAHQEIAFNLVGRLNEALDRHDPSLVATFAPGGDLGLGAGTLAGVSRASSHVPGPDVAVIVDATDPDQRVVAPAVVLAELVSGTDETLSVHRHPWGEVEASLYRMYGPCRTVLAVEQDRAAATCWDRPGDGWTTRPLSNLEKVVKVACCGLRCLPRDLSVSPHPAARPAACPEP